MPVQISWLFPSSNQIYNCLSVTVCICCIHSFSSIIYLFFLCIFKWSIFIFYTAPMPHNDGKPKGTSWITALIVTGVVILGLVFVLVYFVVRHRRLQRSFMSFANSHYDTRSGTATFSADDGDTDLGKSVLWFPTGWTGFNSLMGCPGDRFDQWFMTVLVLEPVDLTTVICLLK